MDRSPTGIRILVQDKSSDNELLEKKTQLYYSILQDHVTYGGKFRESFQRLGNRPCQPPGPEIVSHVLRTKISSSEIGSLEQ